MATGRTPTDRSQIKNIVAQGAAADASGVTVSDKNERDEKQQLEIDGIKEQLTAFRAELGRKADIHSARLWGLGALFALIVVWLAVILKFVYWTGTPADWAQPSGENERMILKLSEPVLIALIGSTTINVIALFVIAAKWLYGNDSKTASPEV